MGRLTLHRLALRTRPDPDNPEQIQIQVALGEGAKHLKQIGIVLDVSIGVDRWTSQALEAQSLRVPSPVIIPAMVDTGASHLALDTSIVNSLNLTRRGVACCDTPAGRRTANLYAVSLSFPQTSLKSYTMLRAINVDLTNQPFKCLIGREIMAHWHLHYNGQSGTISISD